MGKSFGANLVLEGIDFTVASGEILFLMGANGAGKSTLVKILSGVHRPDRGSILIGGRPVRFRDPAAARAAGIVPVHQVVADTGVGALTVAENLVLDGLCGGGFPWFATPRRIRARAAPIALAAGLRLDLDARMDRLSLAERQLVAIARALAGRPKLLILDEPTASLSAGEAERLFLLLERLRAQGTAVLFISHRLSDLARIADRALVLRNGRVAGSFVRPLDLAAATACMLGELPADAPGAKAREDGPKSEPSVLATLRGVRLRPDGPAIDLDLRGGEVAVLTGSLGAGKSSLLELLFGVRRPASGEMRLGDAAWRPHSPAEAIRKGVFLAGEDRWRTSFSAPSTLGADIAGTIAFPHLRAWSGRFGWLNRSRERNAAAEAIRRLAIVCSGPSDRLDLLSGGNQQKVVVARWQAVPSRLLLLDEPFQGIDLGARADLIASLRRLGPGTAVLLATNDLDEALAAGDRILVMRDRRVIAEHHAASADRSAFLAEIASLENASVGEIAG